MSLLNKTANVMHREHGFFVANGFLSAECGSWGERDGDVFERLGSLKGVNQGVPDPRFERIERGPRWYNDKGVHVGAWKVNGAAPGGMVGLSIKVDFESKYGIACYLADFDEVRLANARRVGEALAELYRKPGKAWTMERKWVYAALEVRSGFIVMSNEKDLSVTLNGTGVVNASGVPIKVSLSGVQSGSTASTAMIDLGNSSPMVNLAEIKDSLTAPATWGQMG